MSSDMSNKEWQEKMEKVTEWWMTSSFGSYVEVVNGEFKFKPPTWKDRISEIPHSIAYYTSYPFIWFTCELWHGVKDAWESVFNEYR